MENELIELEKKYWQAIREHDLDTCMKLTNDPCVVAGPSGVASVDHEQLMKIMKNGKYTLNAFSFGDDAKVTSLGDGVAVLAYKVHEDITVDGKPMTIDAADSSTWVKKDGQWLCAAHTESLLGDPFGRDRTH